jgi:hypothetical protein
MTELQIKKNASEAFNLGDYPKAFNTLWELGIEEFLKYSQREDRRNKKNNWLVESRRSTASSSYFWNTFILQQDVFSACFSSQIALELLHNYYSKTAIFNTEFESKLAKEFPVVYIEAIRKNEVFFREDRITFLLKDGLLNDHYSIHQDVWEYFQDTELELWKEIKSTILEIEKYSLEQILFFTVMYFETNNFDANFDIQNQSALANVYNFFIDLILRNSNIKESNLNSEQFAMDFSMTLIKDKYPKLKTAVFKCLSLIEQRQSFSSNIFQPYCFNNNFEPKYIYESLYLYESPESKYQWNLDEIRYKVNEQVYNQKGRIIVDNQLENGGVIPTKKKEDYLNNKLLAYNLRTIIETLKDLKLTEFYFNNNNNNKSIKVEALKMIKPMYVYAFNKLVRYYEPLKNIKKSSFSLKDNWQEALLYLVQTKRDSYQLPFIYHTKQEYFNLNINADKGFEEEIGHQVLNEFGVNRLNLKKFDRFNLKYSVIDTPFILLGNFIFSPILFFVGFTNQNVYVNTLLKNNNRNNRRTAIEIENVLGNLLIRHNFEVKRLTKQEVNSVDGDADIIITDKHNVLLIQLKRTKFHLDDKAQYYEFLNTDLKAANQLNRIEKYLNEENSIFDLKNRKVTKWIVSNSFEKVNTKIKDCLKVNYLDIVNVLKNNEGMIFKSLPDFISFFNNDTYFDSISKQMIEDNDSFKTMFSLTGMNHRNLLCRDFDSNKGQKYRHYFNIGLELNVKGNNKGAIKVLNECLKLETEDFEVHGEIANTYADLKNYEKAIFHFKKALEIVPNEPLVKMNYAFTLRDSGDPIFLKIYSEIIADYPFLNLSS